MTRHANKPTIDRTTTSLQEAELWLGPSARIGSQFRNDDERRQLWLENRERLMRLFAVGGRRPFGWWRYDAKAPGKYPSFNLEKSTLWSAGLIEPDEARQLEAEWRLEFFRSLEPGFTFHDGPRGILTGGKAHIAHLVFHDVPPELCEQWALGAAPCPSTCHRS